MAENTKVEWADHTFNPWRGCTKVSAGCANCYADTQAKRNPGVLGQWGPNGTRVVASEAMWREPLKWDKAAKADGVRRRVFCASMADVFEDWQGAVIDSQGRSYYVDDVGAFGPGAGHARRHATMQDVRNRLFRLISATPNLDWLLLTKRPENILRMLPTCKQCETIGRVVSTCSHCNGVGQCLTQRNVWLGTSVEDQATADERIPHLLQVPAAVRFLSMEPLLADVIVDRWLGDAMVVNADGSPFRSGQGIDWVIVGGESGPSARPMHPNWVRSLRDQCKAAGVPFFFKQWGEHDAGERPTDADEVVQLGLNRAVRWLNTAGGSTHTNWDTVGVRKVGKAASGRLLDGREWNEFPKGSAS